MSNKRPQNKCELRRKKVHLVFGFTGGGTEYLVGVFALLDDAQKTADSVLKRGHNSYVVTQKIHGRPMSCEQVVKLPL